MTECDYVDCENNPVGTVKWGDATGQYCNYHIRQVRVEFPGLYEEIVIE